MTPFLDKMLRSGATIATALDRGWERIKRFFPSNEEVARRAAEKLETLERREMEAERIDRLTNPSNYQGK
jgi:hypothetical protein